jgi:hypothetical protein
MTAASDVPELSSYTMNFEPVGLDGLNRASRLNGLNGLNRLRLFVSAAVEQLERFELIADSSGE